MKTLLATLVSAICTLSCLGHTDATGVRIYIANDDHTDFMWSTDEAGYDQAFLDLLDFHLDLIDQTDHLEAPFQNRFNADGWYWIDRYEALKPPADYARLIQRIREGRISVPLNALASCFGAQPTEAVLRGMYPAGKLERRHGFRIPLAVAMENQGLPLGLASLWAGAGAQYTWRGVCACVPKKYIDDELRKRQHEIYWYEGLDGNRLLMKWYSLAGWSPELQFGGNKFIGGYAEAFDPEKAIQYLSSDQAFLDRYRPPGGAEPYRIRGAFGYGWDALARKTGEPYLPNPKMYPETDHFHEVAQAHTTPDRQIIVSNESDFFDDFHHHYADTLPTMRVTHGNEWDLYSASLSETSAEMRRGVEALRNAEALAAWVQLHDPSFMEGRDAARHAAYVALGLYWEHNWTADGPLPREERALWAQRLARDLQAYVSTLQSDATAAFGRLIPARQVSWEFFVFNSLSWPRTGAADVAYSGPESIHVVERASGKAVPHQIMRMDEESFLRIHAEDVPPVGYRVYSIKPGPGPAFSHAAIIDQQPRPMIFENACVRLGIERDGAITSFVDKRSGPRELAAEIDGLFLNDFADHRIHGDWTQVENAGPVSVTMLANSKAARNHVSRITLYRDSPRVDLDNQIVENFGDVRHWAFSFAMDNPVAHTEEIGALIRLRLEGDGGHYAERAARYDYASLNHFCDLSDPQAGFGVTLSNRDLAFMKLGRSTPRMLDTQTAQINVLAGGQVDGDRLGIRGQHGANRFLQRFALYPHDGYNAIRSMQFALEHQNPFVTGTVTGQSQAPLPPDSDSLLSIAHPGALLWSLKPAEDGPDKGTVVRIWNLNDQPCTTDLHWKPGLAQASRTTHIETDLRPVHSHHDRIPLEMASQEMQTFRILTHP